MKSLWILVAALAAVAAPARAAGNEKGDASATAARAEALEAMDAGVTAADPAAILGARATLAALQAEHADDAGLLYWMAVADWRAVPLMQSGNRKAAERQCDAGLAAIEKALALEPKNAEMIAMRAALQGVSLGFKDPAASMTLGPEMVASFQQATKLAPEDPRVLLLDAINTYHMPDFVGGGPQRAVEKLEKARVAFEAEPVAPEHWGHEDVYIWLGRAAMAREDWDAAEAWLRKALELKPDHAWAGKSLLPKVQAERAKQAG